jgi:hypothetical protein
MGQSTSSGSPFQSGVRKPAMPVPVLERPPDRGRHRPRAPADIEHPRVGVVRNLTGARVSCDPPGRLRGNTLPSTGERRLTLTGVLPERTLVHVHHNLVALRRSRGKAPAGVVA